LTSWKTGFNSLQVYYSKVAVWMEMDIHKKFYNIKLFATETFALDNGKTNSSKKKQFHRTFAESITFSYNRIQFFARCCLYPSQSKEVIVMFVFMSSLVKKVHFLIICFKMRFGTNFPKHIVKIFIIIS
jgi:hypothetical protein